MGGLGVLRFYGMWKGENRLEEDSSSPPPQSGSGGYQPVGLWLSLPEASTGVSQLSVQVSQSP